MANLFFRAALLPDGWAENVRITMQGGKILRVAPGAAAEAGDEHHAAALPGLCNVHSHAFQRGMAGLAETRGPEGDNFWTWREVMYRFLDQLTPDDVEVIAELAYIEMLETGFTRVGEFHYLHHDPAGAPYDDIAELAVRIAAASSQTGIALTLLPVFYAHGNFGGAPPVPGQRRFLNNADGFARLMEESRRAITHLDDANIGVAPHSLRAVTPDELRGIVPLAKGGPVHIHAAEQTKEVDDCVAWSGARPVQWLLDHVGVDANWCLIHATHMDDGETEGLAKSGATAGLCPITEANLGDGVFPTPAYLACGGHFGIGTDSNVLIDPAGELRMLEYAQGNHAARNAWLRARILTALHRCAPRALGASGDWPPGAAICQRFHTHPALAGRSGNALISWIFAASGGVVDCVGAGRNGRRMVATWRREIEAVSPRLANILG